jgi:ligand-binding sensor domain-containing protein
LSTQAKFLSLVAVVALVIGAYFLGSSQRSIAPVDNQATTSSSTGSGSAETAVDSSSMPENRLQLDQPQTLSQSIQNNAEQEKSNFTHFRVGNRNVKSIFAEKDKVWVGTSGGVIRYVPEIDDYRLFDTKNGLLANGIFHVSRWTDSKMLVGTYGGGLAIYDEFADKFEIFNVPDGLADAFVYDVLVMPDGDLWIATWSGANRVKGGRLDDPKAWETYTVENTNGGLPNDWVYGLDLGKNGDVWFATEGGLSLFRDEQWTSWNHKDGQGAVYDLVKDDNTFMTDPATVSSHHAKQKIEMDLQNVDTAYNPNYIVSLEVDKDGIVWVGTWGGGLARFDGSEFKNYTVKDGLPSNHVFMLHEDKKGVLWVGTSNGMAQINNGQFDNRMTVHDGLFSNTVFSMDTQQDGTLWIGNFGGVSRIIK